MKNSGNQSTFSFGKDGSARNEIYLTLLQLHDAQIEPYIAHGSFDTNQETAEILGIPSLTPRCAGTPWWINGTPPTPVFDGYNCYLAHAPQDSTSVWMTGSAYHYTHPAGSACTLGVSSGGDTCYVGNPMPGKVGFIHDDAYYTLP